MRPRLGPLYAVMKADSPTTMQSGQGRKAGEGDRRQIRKGKSALSMPQTVSSSNSEQSPRYFHFPLETELKESALQLCCCEQRSGQPESAKLGYRALAKPPMSRTRGQSSRRQGEKRNTSCRYSFRSHTSYDNVASSLLCSLVIPTITTFPVEQTIDVLGGSAGTGMGIIWRTSESLLRRMPARLMSQFDGQDC
jgi:hypothetical protein